MVKGVLVRHDRCSPFFFVRRRITYSLGLSLGSCSGARGSLSSPVIMGPSHAVDGSVFFKDPKYLGIPRSYSTV